MQFLIADDHDIVRTGLKYLVRSIYPKAVIDEAQNVKSLFNQIQEKDYDVLITDLNMDEQLSASNVVHIVSLHPAIKIIVFSGLPEELFAIHYIKAGAKAYLNKNFNCEVLGNAIDAVLNNRRYLSTTVRAQMEELTFNRAPHLFQLLSGRETEVLKLLLEGEPTSMIANTLNLNQTTVCTYKRRIFTKLNTTNIMKIRELMAVTNLHV